MNTKLRKIKNHKPAPYFKNSLEKGLLFLNESKQEVWNFNLAKQVFEAMGFQEWIKTDSQLFMVHEEGMSVAIKENGHSLLTFFSWNMNLPENEMCSYFSSLSIESGPRIRAYYFNVNGFFDFQKAVHEGSHLHNGFELKDWDIYTLKHVFEAFYLSFINDDSLLSHQKGLKEFCKKSSNSNLKKISNRFLKNSEELFQSSRVSIFSNVVSATISELYPKLKMNTYGPDKERKALFKAMGSFISGSSTISWQAFKEILDKRDSGEIHPLILCLEAMKRFISSEESLKSLDLKGYNSLVDKVKAMFKDLSIEELKGCFYHNNWLYSQLFYGLLDKPLHLQMMLVILEESKKKDVLLAQDLFSFELFEFKKLFEDDNDYSIELNRTLKIKFEKDRDLLRKELSGFMLNTSPYIFKNPHGIENVSNFIKDLENSLNSNTSYFKIIINELQKVVSEKLIYNTISSNTVELQKRF